MLIPGGFANPLRPTLDLTFLAPAQTLDSRSTFTRASAKHCFDASGALVSVSTDTPAFDHDPVTLAPRGLLLEAQSANLLLNSASLSTQNVTTTAQTYTLSFYGTGTVTLSGTYSGSLVGSGAFPTRSILTFTATAGTLTLTVSGTVQYANLEANNFASSWILTTGATATRSADVLTMNVSSIPFNASEGTVVIRFVQEGLSSIRRIFLLDGATGEFIVLTGGAATPSQLRWDIFSSGSAQSQMIMTATSAVDTLYKSACAWKANDFAGCLNGGTVVTDASGSIPTVTTLDIGGLGNIGGSRFSGWLQRVQMWPRRLSNLELQRLTT